MRHLGNVVQANSFLPRLSIATTPFLLIGCAGPLSTIDPAGPHARSVATLWWVMLAGATVLATLVFVLLALSFRRTSRAVSDRTWILGLGLAMPVGVLGTLLVYALVVGSSLLPTPVPDGVRVEVVAKRYGWAFRSPSGRLSDGVLHLPAGRPVDLAITSTDVIHSLWIPRLAGKMDAMPGHVNVLRVQASEPGEYRGECAEYCGTGHKEHGFRVIAHDPASWTAYEGAGN